MTELGLDGVIAFPVTAMDERGEAVDIPTYQALISRIVDAGVHSVVPLGSTGEFAYLDPEERKAVVQASVEALTGRVPVIAGVSALATADAVAYARHAAQVGANGVMLSIPTYYPLGTAEVHAHVSAVAAATDLPLVLYNNPYTSNVDLTPDLLERLKDIDTLVAVKEATMDVNRIPLLRDALGDRVSILGGGFDPYALPALVMGARGWTTGMANLVPQRCVALYRAAVLDRDLAAAQQHDRALAPLANLLVRFGLSVTVKAGLKLLGHSAGGPRRPLLPLPEEAERELSEVLSTLVEGTSE